MVDNLPTVQRRYVEIESVYKEDVAAADRRRDAAQAALLRELLADQVGAVVTPAAKPAGSRRRGPERAETTPTTSTITTAEQPLVVAQPSEIARNADAFVAKLATGSEQSQDDSENMF